jgi:hypothetical protein
MVVIRVEVKFPLVLAVVLAMADCNMAVASDQARP